MQTATARRTRAERVENPFGNGIDKTERVIDTITAMHRRHQISDTEAQAAGIYRDAYQLVHGGITGTLDPSRNGGGVARSRAPSEDQLWGAQKLHEATNHLGVIDATLIQWIVGDGLSITDAARRFYGQTTRRNCDMAGGRLRDALSSLADKWQLRPARKGIRTYRPDDAVPHDDGTTMEVERAVVHIGDTGLNRRG